MTINIVLLVVGILATYRLAQIVAQDTISEPFRFWITQRNSPPENLSFLRRWISLGVTCVVCVSVWAGIAIAFILHGITLQAIVYGLAFSGGAVMLGSWLAAQNRSKQ